MGLDLYSESSNTGTSPRISFSHDFCQSDVLVPVESRHHDLRSNSSGLSTSIDFDFCVHRESFGQESYAADELFSDGKILPTEIKKEITPMKQTDDQFGSCPPLPPPRAMREISKQESAMESKGAGRTEVNHDQKQSSKFFWRCTRSTSSCGSGYRRISFCPLPPLLSRSNSTGSAANLKRPPLSNDAQNSKQNTSTSQKHASIKASQSWASKGYLKKPPLKKGHGLCANAHVPISPAILNVPTAYSFGFGLFFSSGKDHKSRK
ncbi:uncharacterized protein LOC121252292 [Juglans microcarpa x Juglans regia]|uniref:uncharacterized protein LOC121252292 n=1 Tax=Juglans microcarpa x Juglans regia TaxID=2249226 RepID=UPI001B7F6607|nr:uncharacterized protein LOC121252292 [Juglans microcarpa x Juglans regia]XP_041007812.1 uncharacterized protein LOC121252292 [Juglans microcarpa x Juglans regia]